MKTEEQVREMKAAKGHEIPNKIAGYDCGYKDGYIAALNWYLGE